MLSWWAPLTTTSPIESMKMMLNVKSWITTSVNMSSIALCRDYLILMCSPLHTAPDWVGTSHSGLFIPHRRYAGEKQGQAGITFFLLYFFTSCHMKYCIATWIAFCNKKSLHVTENIIWAPLWEWNKLLTVEDTLPFRTWIWAQQSQNTTRVREIYDK